MKQVQTQAKQFLERDLSRRIGYQASVKGISLNFPLKLKLSQFSLSDENGLWLKVENIESHLIPGTSFESLHFHQVSAQRVEVFRGPLSPNLNPSSSEKRTKFFLSVHEVSVESLWLGKNLTHLPQDLDLKLTGVYELMLHDQSMRFSADGALRGALFSTFEDVNASVSGHYSWEDQKVTLTIDSMHSQQGVITSHTPLIIDINQQALTGVMILDEVYGTQLHPDIDALFSGEVKLSGQFDKLELDFDVFHPEGSVISGVVLPEGHVEAHWVVHTETDAHNTYWGGETLWKIPRWNSITTSQIKMDVISVELNSIKTQLIDNTITGSLRYKIGEPFVEAQFIAQKVVLNESLAEIINDLGNTTIEPAQFDGIIDVFFQLHPPTQEQREKTESLQQGAVVQLSGNKLKVSNWSAEELALVVSMDDVLTLKTNQLRLDAKKFKANEWQIDQAELFAHPIYRHEDEAKTSSQPFASDWSVLAEWQGSVVQSSERSPFNGNVKAKLTVDETESVHMVFEKMQGNLSTLTFQLDPNALSKLSDVDQKSIAFTQQQVVQWRDLVFLFIDGQNDRQKVGRLETTGEWRIDDQQIAALAKVNEINLDRFKAWLPQLSLPALERSRLNGVVEIQGELSQPSIKSQWDLGPLKVDDISPDVFVQANVDVHKHQLQSSIDIKYELLDLDDDDNQHQVKGVFSEQIIESEVNFPLAFSLWPLDIQWDWETPWQGRLEFRVDVETWLSHRFDLSHQISGIAQGVLALQGSIHHPLLDGSVTVSDGRYKNSEIGFLVKDLQAEFDAKGQTLELVQFTALDRKKRPIKASGKMELNVLNAMNTDTKHNKAWLPFDFRIETPKFDGLRHPIAQASMGADLRFVGNLQKAKLSGDIDIAQLDIHLPEKMMSSVPTLNIVSQVDEDGVEVLIEKDQVISYPVELDIDVKAYRQVFVRGWGVEAELGGDLDIRGDLSYPLVSGTLDVLRGRYEEFGRRFDIEEGTLNFVGELPPSPYLNIVTMANAEGVEIRPIVLGSILSPELLIESTPELPQEEALSLLLFGKDTQRISSIQALQLASTLGRISGQGGGLDPIGQVRKLIRVDDLSVETTGDNQDETTIGIGKYLTDEIYVELEKGTEKRSGKAKIEVEVTPNVSLETTTGEADEHGVGIKWKKDY